MPYNSPLRGPTGSVLPATALNSRNRIAQTMMNIGSPPPQVNPMPPGGLPPGMQMAPTPLKTLMGMEEGGPSSFMGGRAPPIAPQAAPPPPPMPMDTGGGGMPSPSPQPPPQQPADPSTLFAKPPTMPGQGPPIFNKPPTF